MADPFLRPFLAPWTFRFRGKTARILAIVDSFLDEPNRGLAPTHIARQAGLPLYDVARLLSRTPELFVKLPRRGDGITRYRLASSVAAQDEAAIAALVHRHARRENWVYYLLLSMGALMLLVVLLALAPAVL
jgi:hypothetical protein